MSSHRLSPGPVPPSPDAAMRERGRRTATVLVARILTRKWKSFIMNSLLVLAGLMLLTQAHAATHRTLPTRAEFSAAYLSTQLIFEPCADYSDPELGYASHGEPHLDPDIQKRIDLARGKLPQGACTDTVLTELLFRARMLQYGAIADSADPVRIFRRVSQENAELALCKSTRCLRERLQAIVSTFERADLDLNDDATQGGNLMCRTEEFRPAISGEPALSQERFDALLPPPKRSVMEEKCAPDDVVEALLCAGDHGTFLFARCPYGGGNQVNSFSWLFRVNKGATTLLSSTEDGPFTEAPTMCNGLPDLKTSARASMGESNITIYRFNGEKYEAYFSFVDESVGKNWRVARYPELQASPIPCR